MGDGVHHDFAKKRRQCFRTVGEDQVIQRSGVSHTTPRRALSCFNERSEWLRALLQLLPCWLLICTVTLEESLRFVESKP